MKLDWKVIGGLTIGNFCDKNADQSHQNGRKALFLSCDTLLLHFRDPKCVLRTTQNQHQSSYPYALWQLCVNKNIMSMSLFSSRPLFYIFFRDDKKLFPTVYRLLKIKHLYTRLCRLSHIKAYEDCKLCRWHFRPRSIQVKVISIRKY